jgi:hypothetical protein
MAVTWVLAPGMLPKSWEVSVQRHHTAAQATYPKHARANAPETEKGDEQAQGCEAARWATPQYATSHGAFTVSEVGEFMKPATETTRNRQARCRHGTAGMCNRGHTARSRQERQKAVQVCTANSTMCHQGEAELQRVGVGSELAKSVRPRHQGAQA